MITPIDVRIKDFVIDADDPMPTMADGAVNGSYCEKIDTEGNKVGHYYYSQSKDVWVSGPVKF